MARPQRLIRDGGLLLRGGTRGGELVVRGRGRGGRAARLVDVVEAMVGDHVGAAVGAVAAVAALVVAGDGRAADLARQLGLAERGDLVVLHADVGAVLVRDHAGGAAFAALTVRAVRAAQVRGRLLVLGAGAGALAARGDALRRGVVDRVVVVLSRAHVWGPLGFAAAGDVGVLYGVVERFGFRIQLGFGDGARVRLRGLVSGAAVVHNFADIAEEGTLEVIGVAGGASLRAEGEQESQGPDIEGLGKHGGDNVD